MGREFNTGGSRPMVVRILEHYKDKSISMYLFEIEEKWCRILARG